MITYFYWALIFALIGGILFLSTRKFDNIKVGLIASGIIFLAGWGSYYFWLQQIFVKRYGGVMSISVPAGQHHLAATWKDDNLWIENYDPKTNTCIFSEYSKGNLLQGRVTIKNCNPVIPSNQ